MRCNESSTVPETPSTAVAPKPRPIMPRTASRPEAPSRPRSTRHKTCWLSDPARGWVALPPDPPLDVKPRATSRKQFQICDSRFQIEIRSCRCDRFNPKFEICNLESNNLQFLYTLNHGVIQTYLICHNSRSPIFRGNATMVSSKNCIMENCSRLMR